MRQVDKDWFIKPAVKCRNNVVVIIVNPDMIPRNAREKVDKKKIVNFIDFSYLYESSDYTSCPKIN